MKLALPARRHVTVYSGVLASHSKWRSRIVPKAEGAEGGQENPDPERSDEEGLEWDRGGEAKDWEE